METLIFDLSFLLGQSETILTLKKNRVDLIKKQKTNVFVSHVAPRSVVAVTGR